MHALRLLITILLCATALSAHAIFKCRDKGSVEYTDAPCTVGRAVSPTDRREPETLRVDRSEALQRAAADKAELIRLENARHASEQQAEKTRLRQLSAMRTRRQRCDTLLLRKKWLDEDKRAATSRSTKSISKKSRRLAEKYALECGS